jgi:hypothetical protein
MDIILPTLDQQVSPPPWAKRRLNIDIPYLVKESLRRQPNAAPDKVVADLAASGVQVSGIVVGMWMSKLRNGEDRRASVGGRREIARISTVYESAIDRWTNEGGALGPRVHSPDRELSSAVTHYVGGSPA